MSKREKRSKERMVFWEKTDRTGNDTAFAIIDLRIPSENPPTQDVEEGGGNAK